MIDTDGFPSDREVDIGFKKETNRLLRQIADRLWWIAAGIGILILVELGRR